MQRERAAREAHAEKCALVIFSAYNRADYNEPELFVANAVTMLAQFSEAVMSEVTNPRTGIHTRLKWPPKLPELREWCERVEAEHKARERRELLARHRVLIDTPHGLVPEAEAPSEKPSQEARDRAVAHWEEVKAGFEGEKRKQATAGRLEELHGQTLPKLSARALETLGLGAFDRTPEAAE